MGSDHNSQKKINVSSKDEPKKDRTLLPDEYATAFKDSKGLKAFEVAADIRKFEIELYWKRATYFWAFIALVFWGYFSLATENNSEKWHLLLISGIGIAFSYAWYLVNRASKYWQENWEHHLDLLEDGITGPLYKTRLYRSSLDEPDTKDPSVCDSQWLKQKHLFLQLIKPTEPLDVSVSKINQVVSFFIFLVWLFLFGCSAYQCLTILGCSPFWLRILLSFIILLLVIGVLFWVTKKIKTAGCGYKLIAKIRKPKFPV